MPTANTREVDMQQQPPDQALGHHDEEDGLDPLVAHAAARIAYALNDLHRVGAAQVTARGSFQLVAGSQHYEVLVTTSDDDADESPMAVHIRPRPTTPSLLDGHAAHGHSPRKRRCHSPSEENEEHQDEPGQDATPTPLVSDQELLALLSTMRQSTTPQCLDHLRSLIDRLQTTWQSRSNPAWDPSSLSSAAAAVNHPRTTTSPLQEPANNPFTTTTTTITTPSPDPLDPDSPQTTATADAVKQQRELLSKQIQWVEECRRVSSHLTDQRTDTWRTTSAAFHDTNRQDRERFQHRMLIESSSHTHTLNQILAEVRAIGLHAQNMKWETPASFTPLPASNPTTVAYTAAVAPSRVARPQPPRFPEHGAQRSGAARRSSANGHNGA
ncbi:unnamed protein product [Periconia digitata]|uniref:Uncharacterized protein n=1 Tax=Periconia digitata TaxID=1303443 RepID=A0A9W4UPG5_9PLEO|nr:unnamed protein product [Periconia digitata]